VIVLGGEVGRIMDWNPQGRVAPFSLVTYNAVYRHNRYNP